MPPRPPQAKRAASHPRAVVLGVAALVTLLVVLFLDAEPGSEPPAAVGPRALVVGGAASLSLRLTSPAGERLEGFVSLLDPDSGEALRSDDVDWGAWGFDSLQPGTYRVLHAEFGWPHDADGPLAADAFTWPPGSLSRVLGADTVTLDAFEQRTLELVVQPGPGARR